METAGIVITPLQLTGIVVAFILLLYVFKHLSHRLKIARETMEELYQDMFNKNQYYNQLLDYRYIYLPDGHSVITMSDRSAAFCSGTKTGLYEASKILREIAFVQLGWNIREELWCYW